MRGVRRQVTVALRNELRANRDVHSAHRVNDESIRFET
jgi:hypothetical protein